MSIYINFDFELFYINELSLLDKLLYSHIRNYTNSKKGLKFDKSVSTIARDFNVSERTIKRSLSLLKQYGLIKVIRIKGAKVCKGDSQRNMYKSIELKRSKLYKEKYLSPGVTVDIEEVEKASQIIEEMKQKFHR